MDKSLFIKAFFATSLLYLHACGGSIDHPELAPQTAPQPAPALDPKPDIPSPAEQTVIVDTRPGRHGGRHE